MKGFIVQPTYFVEDNKAYVKLYGRLENGESFLSTHFFRPYFFIRKKDLVKARDYGEFESEETKLKNFSEETMVKILLETPKEIPKLRKELEEQEIECFEADIRFPYRFMMDNNLWSSLSLEGEYTKGERIDRIYTEPKISSLNTNPKIELKTLSFDIETDGHAKKLYSIAVSGTREETIYVGEHNEKKGTEKEALQRFKQIIQEDDPDILTGWNVIDFDLAVLSNLYKKHNISFDIGRSKQEASLRLESGFIMDSKASIPGRVVLDGIMLLKTNFYKLEDYKLETAAQTFLGKGKTINENKVKEIERQYREEPEKLLEYNLQDAKLVTEILDKEGLIALTQERSFLVGMPLDRVQASIASLDSLYIREANKIGYVVHSLHYNEKEKGISGGFVMRSKPGIYDNIAVLDFKSLYPSIIMTYNIDPLTYHKGGPIKAPNGATFSKEEGLLPKILDRLMKSRDEMKKKNDKVGSYAIKIHMNSIYGVLASPSCRFYSYEMADGITSFGRGITKKAAELSEEDGHDVIYGDSVSADTKVIINNSQYKEIHELFTTPEKQSGTKEYCFPKIEVLTLQKGKSVFKPIKYVMRHKTKKKMFRVYFTNYWHIDVTEDHSLIGYLNKSVASTLKDHERLVPVRPEEIGEKIKSIITLSLDQKNYKTTPVKKIEEIEYDDYVYDIEVEDTHTFFANNVLVHNTDSIFVNPKGKAKEIAKEIEKKINNHFDKEIKEKYARKNYLQLEFEKLYTKFFMPHIRGSTAGAKKRYAGLLNGEIDFTGLEFVRRDWTKLSKEFQLNLLWKIFKDEEPTAFIKEFVEKLEQGKYDDLLVYRKALRKSTDEYTKTTPPHVKAARKLEEKGKLESPIIDYIITTNGPEPVSMLKSKIDYEHYIEKQIKPIADSVLVFFNTSFDDLMSGSGQSSLFDF